MQAVVSRYELPPDLFPPQPTFGEEHKEEIEIRNCFTFPTAKNLPHLVFLVASSGAVGAYRSWLPARELAKSGEFQVTVAWGKWRSQLASVLESADCLILSIPSDKKLLEYIKKLKEVEKLPLVVDLDDRLDIVPLSNSAWAYWKENFATLAEFIEIADLVTTPSRDIQRFCITDQHKPAERVVIVPNFVDGENPIWDEPAPSPEAVTVGFTGSYSHIRDVALIEKPVRRILTGDTNTRFVVYGPIELRHALDLPVAQTRWKRCRSFATYPSVLRSWQIGLCPLEPTPFNAGKSAIKPIEMIAAGVYPICSAWGPYQELADGISRWAAQRDRWSKPYDGPHSILPLAADEDQWYEEIRKAVHQELLTVKRFELLREYVMTHCLSSQLSMLPGLYSHLLKS